MWFDSRDIDDSLQPGITAEEFNTRLMAMSETLDIRELFEISTLIVNVNKEDFDEIDGWELKVYTNNERLDKEATLGSLNVKIWMDIIDNKVSGQEYFIRGVHDEFLDFIKHHISDENNLSIIRDDETHYDLIECKEVAHEILLTALRKHKQIRMSFHWYHISENNDRTRVMYMYTFAPDSNRDSFSSMVKFG
jgi:hypothetical protein